MASLREIKDRIGSVKSTLKITSAMKLVASAKLRKAQNAIEALIPYEKTLEDIMSRVAPAMKRKNGGDSMEEPGSRRERIGIVCISSNASLCGGFNASVTKKALQTLEQLRKDADVTVFPIGRKMAEAMKKAGAACVGEDLNHLAGKFSYDDAADLAKRLTEGFEDGLFDRIILVYNHFVSSSSQKTVIEDFLPMKTAAGKAGEDGFILEPDAEEIAGKLMPKVLSTRMYATLLDSQAAEHAARTMAMQSATDNGERILAELTLEYNKGRQQKITSEILDLIGGAQ